MLSSYHREMDFSLKEIGSIINNPGFDKKTALENQKELLSQKRKRLGGLISLIDDMMEGDNAMSFKEFDMSEINKLKKEYAAEIKERWGCTEAFAESEKKTAAYSKEQWAAIQEEMQQLFETFSELHTKKETPDCEEAQNAVRRWQDFITTYFYPCSNEILAGLGAMYTEDERFRKNLDKNGEGTADWLSKAIACYCSQKK